MGPLPALTNFVTSLLSLNTIPPSGGDIYVTAPSHEHQTTNSPHQHLIAPSLPSRTTIRLAVPSDLPAITTILTSAFAGTPAWDFGYQFRTKHPYYHWECLRQQLSLQWNAINRDTTWVRVIEDAGVVVSVAVWRLLDQRNEGYRDDHNIHAETILEVNNAAKVETEPTDCSLHLDQNITRVTSFKEQLSRLRRPYIEEAYIRQLHLETLATYPQAQGWGYASELVRWGVMQAKELGVDVVTVVCREEVVGFYRAVGFVELGEMHVRRLDGGVLRFGAMRFGW